MPNYSPRALRAALALALCVMHLSTGQSYAQSEDTTSIEEIVVTSRYRAEKLSDVPDSITPFTAEESDTGLSASIASRR